MGLDVSHDAFHGAYSAFNRFRQAVCWAAGGSFPFHNTDSVAVQERMKVLGVEKIDQGMWYTPDEVTRETHPGLYLFLSHSDCDGEISPTDCTLVADDLQQLVETVDAYPFPAGGHLERNGGYRAVLQQFIDGCRAAAEAGEPLDFH